jgi:hypothetical protein
MPDASSAGRSRPLTVAQLRNLLRAMPGEVIVVLSADGEGNRYSPLFDVAEGKYHQTGLLGDIYPTTEELRQDPELRILYPDGIPKGAAAAVVLYPMA